MSELEDAIAQDGGPVDTRAGARLLTVLHLADAVAKGIFLSGSVVYFTTVSHLSPVQVAFGVSAAGASGFAASLLFGIITDRWGAKPLLVLVLALQAGGFSLYPLVHGPALFFILIVALGFLEYGAGPVLAVLIGALAPADEKVRFRARLRTIYNAGVSAASGLVALALIAGDEFLRLLPFVTAVLLLAAAGWAACLPDVHARVPSEGKGRFVAIREGRFVLVVALSAVLAMHSPMILVVLPLWVLEKTDAPRSLVPLILVANTVLAILLQVWASRDAEDLPGAARLAQRSSLWLATGCVAAACGAYGGRVAASAALVVATLLFTMSELQQSASAWGLSFELAPPDRQGEFHGVFQLHFAVSDVVGPGLASAVVFSFGFVGWLVIAATVLLAGLCIGPAASAVLPARHPGDRPG